jgi:hypothetical protein
MKGLATLIMRGPSQAALVSAVMALLSVLFAPLGLLSAAAVGLVTLRGGPINGLTVVGIGTVGLAALAWLTLGSPVAALGVLAMLWIPILALAVVLRATRSLTLVVQIVGLLALLILLILYAMLDDPAASWIKLLEPFREAIVKEGVVTEADSGALFAEVAQWMTGAFTAALAAQLLLGLFIARWWQALLYNPGGFGEEFRALDLGRVFGGLAVILLVLLPLMGQAGLLVSLLMVMGLLLLLQGLAVVHQARVATGANRGWLVALYILLSLLPQTLVLVASVGFVDIWAKIRPRLLSGASGGAGGPKPPL